MLETGKREKKRRPIATAFPQNKAINARPIYLRTFRGPYLARNNVSGEERTPRIILIQVTYHEWKYRFFFRMEKFYVFVRRSRIIFIICSLYKLCRKFEGFLNVEGFDCRNV